MRAHTLIQLICVTIASVTTFLVYGLRESEGYEEDAFISSCGGFKKSEEAEFLELDEFLISDWPLALISIPWGLTFLFQWQHSHRLEIEATSHRRSVEEQYHGSRIYRVIDYIDRQTKSALEFLAVNEQEARVSPFLMAFPGAIASIGCLMSVWVLAAKPEKLEDIIMDPYNYVFYHLSWCINVSSGLMACVFVFSDLEKARVIDVVVSIPVCLFFFVDGIISYLIGEHFGTAAMAIFGCICFASM